MSKKTIKSQKLFRSGYNCAQAVFCTFCEDLGIDFETGLKLSSSFGGGMGKLREVCGAVSSMFMIIGLKYGYCSNDNQEEKTQHYKLIQDLAEEFKRKNKTIICRELLNKDTDGHVPELRSEKYYVERPCEKFVIDAVKIIETYLK